MKRQTNEWFPARFLLDTITAIHTKATTDHLHWLLHSKCKYVQVNIDQRTGDFILLDSNNDIVEDETLFAMFPVLKELN